VSVESATQWVREVACDLVEAAYRPHLDVRWDGSAWVVRAPSACVGLLTGEGGRTATALRTLAWAYGSARHLFDDDRWLNPEQSLQVIDGGRSDVVAFPLATPPQAAAQSAGRFVEKLALAVLRRGGATAEAHVDEEAGISITVRVPERVGGRLMGRGGRNIEAMRLLLRCHLRAHGWRGGVRLVADTTPPENR